MTKRRSALVAMGIASVLALVVVQASSAAGKSKRLIGKSGGARDDYSSYIDLVRPTNFASGDRLLIKLEGPASFVVVRLLPKGFPPAKPDVIVAEKLAVRADRTVEVRLTSDYKDIVHVSVHSGPMPWGIFDLGSGNGYVTMTSVEHFSN